jgi:hypothetical protein
VGADVIRVQMKSAKMDGPARRVELIASQLTDFREPIAAGLAYVREETRKRFEARGLGEWPPLKESTVARKTSSGAPDPQRQLYEFGDLFESATSSHGPYSVTVIEPTWGAIGIDWSENGRQIPVILSEGNLEEGGSIPPRPIYPRTYELANGVSRIVRNWVRAPVEPRALGGAGGPWVGAETPPLP